MHLEGPRPWWWVDGHYSSYNYELWGEGDGGQDCESHDDDISEVLAEDKEYMKANANRVPMEPSDCNRGMYVWASTVGPEPNEKRKPRWAAPKLVRGVSWSEVATVPKRKSHRGLDLNLSWNSEEDIWKGRKESDGTK